MALSTTPSRPRDTQLTPRQREVLRLIARGYTNARIGEELGISLDGAKWHVSEVITRLGVDTREEAADWWRAQNGLRPRLAHLARALLLPWWKVAALASGAVAAGSAAVVAVILALPGDAAAPGSVAVTPSAVASVAPTPVASTTPDVVAGVTAQPLSVGAPIDFPAGLVLYYQVGAWASDATTVNLWRLFRDSSGNLHRDNVFATFDQYAHNDRPGVRGWVADDRMAEILATVCERTDGQGCDGQATGLGGNIPGSPPIAVYRSHDGGGSWTRGGEIPSDTRFIALTANGALTAKQIEHPGAAVTFEFGMYPSGDAVQPPAPGYWPTYVPGVGLTWGPNDSAADPIYGPDGSLIYQPQFDSPREGREEIVARDPAGGLLVRALYVPAGDADPHPYTAYYGRTDADGKVTAAWSFVGIPQILQAFPVDQDRYIGFADLGGTPQAGRGFNVEAVLFDLKADTIRPLADVAVGLTGNQNPFVQRAITGSFLQVTGAGDCLNVRRQASTEAETLGCFRDGVLLADRQDRRGADGDEWLAVQTPDGRDGWASAAYLR